MSWAYRKCSANVGVYAGAKPPKWQTKAPLCCCLHLPVHTNIAFILLLLFSCSALSDSLWPHGLQHSRLPYPSSSPRACSNSCPLSRWCHPTISSSASPFSSCPQSFPPSGSFPMSQLFTSGSHRFSISPSNEYSGIISYGIDWFDLLTVQGTLKSLLQHHSSKASILWPSAFFMVQLSHPHVTTRKTIALTIWTCVSQVMPLLFKRLSRFVIAFFPRSKHLFISWLQSPSAVILEPKKIKSIIVSPSICHEVMGPDAMILIFWMLHLLGQNN